MYTVHTKMGVSIQRVWGNMWCSYIDGFNTQTNPNLRSCFPGPMCVGVEKCVEESQAHPLSWKRYSVSWPSRGFHGFRFLAETVQRGHSRRTATFMRFMSTLAQTRDWKAWSVGLFPSSKPGHLQVPSWRIWGVLYRYIFSGMNIHLPAILMFTRGTRFWHTAN